VSQLRQTRYRAVGLRHVSQLCDELGSAGRLVWATAALATAFDLCGTHLWAE